MGNGKVAWITGASSGIGFASAKKLLENGFKVYATARRTHLMQPLEQLGAVVMSCDVTQDEDVAHVADTILATEGRIDVLFANAGFVLLGPVELHTIEDIRYHFDVNVLGNARAFSAVLPHMRQQKSGRIIITSSAVGHVGSPGLAWYPATKHAQQGVADGLRMEVKEFGIKVSLIEPGFIATGIVEASVPYLDKCEKHENAAPYKQQIQTIRKKFSQNTHNGASPDVIAKVVLHAATSRSPKRRYSPTFDAKLVKFTRHILGYRVVDRILPGQTIR